jgi:hypothetical protein
MDGGFVPALASVAILIGLVTFLSGRSRGRARWEGRSALFGDGHAGGFNSCRECGASLPTAEDAPWRLVETCVRCGMVQEWAVSRPDEHPMPVEPWSRVERIEPLPRRPGVPAQGVRPREVPRSAAPTPSRTPGRPREAGPVDPFALKPADDARTGLGLSRVQRRSVHRPSPDRRGFRRKGPISRVSSARGERGFNCCGSCGAPLPPEPDREWRFAGTCPRCGQVQIWAI